MPPGSGPTSDAPQRADDIRSYKKGGVTSCSQGRGSPLPPFLPVISNRCQSDFSRKSKELFFVHAAKARYSFAADPMGKYGATPREYAGHHQLENWFEMTEWGTFFCHPEPSTHTGVAIRAFAAIHLSAHTGAVIRRGLNEESCTPAAPPCHTGTRNKRRRRRSGCRRNHRGRAARAAPPSRSRTAGSRTSAAPSDCPGPG